MRGNTRRCQAENPLIALSSFLAPALGGTKIDRARKISVLVEGRVKSSQFGGGGALIAHGIMAFFSLLQRRRLPPSWEKPAYPAPCADRRMRQVYSGELFADHFLKKEGILRNPREAARESAAKRPTAPLKTHS